MTGCFASGGGGLPELGIGTAEEDVVLEAWKLHMTLIKNAKVRGSTIPAFYIRAFYTMAFDFTEF